NAQNTVLPPFHIGEIAISGPGVFIKTLNNYSKTVEISFNHNTYNVYKTGDIGYLDDSYEFHILGRVDDIIKVRGFRLSLNAISQMLKSLEPKIENIFIIRKETKLVAYAYGEHLS